MNDKDYDLILDLYKFKNITRTARKLYISQPALTKKIRKIEEELNTEIVIRSQQGIVFTPTGEQLVRYAEMLQNTIRDMKDSINDLSDEVAGKLRLGIASLYAHYELPTVLSGYLDKYPKVDFSIEADKSSTIFNLLKSNKISIGIIRIDYDWQDGKILLSEEPVCLVYKKEVSLKDLEKIPYIQYSTSPYLQLQLDNWFNENKISQPHNTINTNTINTCVEFVKKGIGWSILPMISLHEFDGYTQDLTWKNGDSFSRKTYLYYREEYSQLSTVSTFIDYVVNR